MRVIAEKENAFNIRFKGPAHNHDISDYSQSFAKTSVSLGIVKSEHLIDDKARITGKTHLIMDSDMEWNRILS